MNSNKLNRYRSSENALFRAYGLDPQEEVITIKKLDSRVRVQTIGSGPPLLFVHGAPNSGSTWVQLLPFFPSYKCILLDRPGCGLSEPISYKNISGIDDVTEIIVSVIDGILDHFNIESASFVPSSFGGYLVLMYTLQRPKRVNKLIFEGCPAMVEGSHLPPFLKIILAPVLKQIIPKLPTTKSFFRVILRKLGHGYSVDHKLIPDVFVDWYVSLFNNTNTQANDMSFAGKGFRAGKMKREFILHDAAIEKVSQPTLWLWGMDDPFGGIEIGKRLNLIMKNSSIFILDNSGHLPWIDKPEIQAVKINEFLSAI